MKKLLLLLILAGSVSMIGLESCSKTAYIEAIVTADGDENVDGCGWLLNIGGNLFYPVGLRNEDKVDGKRIEIQYTVSAVPHTCVDNQKYPVSTITRYKN